MRKKLMNRVYRVFFFVRNGPYIECKSNVKAKGTRPARPSEWNPKANAGDTAVGAQQVCIKRRGKGTVDKTGRKTV